MPCICAKSFSSTTISRRAVTVLSPLLSQQVVSDHDGRMMPLPPPRPHPTTKPIHSLVRFPAFYYSWSSLLQVKLMLRREGILGVPMLYLIPSCLRQCHTRRSGPTAKPLISKLLPSAEHLTLHISLYSFKV